MSLSHFCIKSLYDNLMKPIDPLYRIMSTCKILHKFKPQVKFKGKKYILLQVIFNLRAKLKL